MTSIRRLLPIIYCCLLMGCGVLDKQVIGNYIEKTLKDTLQLHPNHAYQYVEKLNSGNLGSTEGKWKSTGHKIRFICDHQPLVGYRLKIRKDSSSNGFQIKFRIGDTENPVEIKAVAIYKNEAVLKANSLKISKNCVRFLTTDFDSIAVKANNFQPISFPVTLNKSQRYIARVYPNERFYELDKVVFKIDSLHLNSVKRKRDNNTELTFIKITQ